MSVPAMSTPFLPLAGIRVLDFSHVIAGPMASFYLAQLGASVTKVEGPHGDIMRKGRGLPAFVALNAGKDCIRLDLTDAADLQRAHALAADADVLLDSLRPGVLDGFGLGAEALRERHPRLIYCAVSGFGRRGPWAHRPAYDHVVQAATGMAMMAGNEGDAPVKTGFPVVDSAAGIVAALAILATLRERDATGQGRFIDVAMSAAAMQLMYPMACAALTEGTSPPRVGNQGYSGSPAADIFDAADGHVALGANTPRQFVALLQVLGCEALASDQTLFDPPLTAASAPEFLRAKDPARLRTALVAAVRGWPAAALEAACAQAQVPAARVRRIAEFAAEAQAADGLGTLPLQAEGVQVISPGLGFRVS
jgi:formyl-CoA transferase